MPRLFKDERLEAVRSIQNDLASLWGHYFAVRYDDFTTEEALICDDLRTLDDLVERLRYYIRKEAN